MIKANYKSIIGLRGVVHNENRRVRYWAHKFELPMIMIAIWIIIEWYASSQGVFPPLLNVMTDWFVWGFFFIETALLTRLADDRVRYLSTNWLNLLIIILAFPVLWHSSSEIAALRTLRVFLVLPLLIGISKTARGILAKNKLGLTLLVALFIIIAAGILIAGIDPAIHNIWDGFWWAWVTVTTVGYGDIVPSSAAGRVFGGLLILFGLGLFSLITANFSAFLLAKEEEEIIKDEKIEMIKLQQIDQRLDNLENILERMEKTLTEKKSINETKNEK
jgi:voltage-gated potassium channel